jgi:hypothetical protein
MSHSDSSRTILVKCQKAHQDKHGQAFWRELYYAIFNACLILPIKFGKSPLKKLLLKLDKTMKKLKIGLVNS